MTKSATDYSGNGITYSPTLPVSGEKVEITYDGLLPQSGATEVFTHLSFDNWESVQERRMTKDGQGFVTAVDIPKHVDKLHFCFRDPTNNWDNNSGSDYSIEISSGNKWDWERAAWPDHLSGGL